MIARIVVVVVGWSLASVGAAALLSLILTQLQLARGRRLWREDEDLLPGGER